VDGPVTRFLPVEKYKKTEKMHKYITIRVGYEPRITLFKTLHIFYRDVTAFPVDESLWTKRLSRAAQHTTHKHNQDHSKQRTTRTQKHDTLPQHQS